MERRLYFKLSFVFITHSCLIISANSSEVPRPRGVSISRAPLYNPEKDFTCFDGTLTIPFSQVNDDYCDCSDASDEPGTPACPNGSFHCTNAGHKPLNIPSYRVNDGVCDCCDASDEYANSNVNCANNCNELGRSAREEALKQAELLKAGKQIRSEYIQRSSQIKQEKKDMLSELEKNLSEADKVKNEKQVLKDQVEVLENAALQKYREIEEAEKLKKQEAENAKNREEATETFKLFDSNEDGKVDTSEIRTRQTFDKDRNGEVSEEEAKYFLNEKEELGLEEFISDGWSRVKPFLMMDAGLFKPPVPEKEEEETEQVEDVHDDIEGSETEPVEEIEEHESVEGEGEEIDEDDEEEEEEVTEEPASEPVKYDEETQKLIEKATEARKEFTDAEKEVRHIQAEIKKLEEYLEKDFGPEDEFAPLEGDCFDYEDYEYIYKLCPFDKAVQKPKSNSVETRLGVWSNWLGSEDNKYSSMLYDRGQSCWNGPQRSTHVRINCGSENKLTAVSEPNRCEYLFDFTTPAACKEAESDTQEDLHDEL
ncbi:HLH domain-containing protein [Oryctes borbonicus]|uniref:Glucosidase 2 subunit beta n=1 Tax=Oryctes borbonicus TaxID=1629725 RepID=A0A0T6B3W1_9SCAR|nr:HLH domain-containing protein [Oryctes borbonicus]